MMIKSLRQLGTRAALTGACLASFACLLMPSAQAQGMGYSKPHVDLAANNMQPAYPPSAQINGENRFCPGFDIRQGAADEALSVERV
jgi:hypothetical protein